MSVSSKFGLKIGSHSVFELKGPQDAIELVRAVCEQYLGQSFTTYQPRCPICDSNLCDHEKNMNKPIGECTNSKCGATVYPADFIGKILDILSEWDKSKDSWEEKLRDLIINQDKRAEQEKKAESKTSFYNDDDDDDDNWPSDGYGGLIKPKKNENKTAGFMNDADFIQQIDGNPVFLW